MFNKKFSFMPLEDRIVLDGALATAATLAASPTPTSHADGAHVLIVPTNVPDAAELQQAAKAGVVVVSYDPANENLSDLQKEIAVALNGQKAASIAFVAEGSNGSFSLSDDIHVNKNSLNNDAVLAQFWRDIAKNLDPNGQLDILACNLVKDDTGQQFIQQFTDLINDNGSNIIVNASTGFVGDADANASWILDIGLGIDASTRYFDQTLISSWDNNLSTNISIDNAEVRPEDNAPYFYNSKTDNNIMPTDNVGLFYKISSDGTQKDIRLKVEITGNEEVLDVFDQDGNAQTWFIDGNGMLVVEVHGGNEFNGTKDITVVVEIQGGTYGGTHIINTSHLDYINKDTDTSHSTGTVDNDFYILTPTAYIIPDQGIQIGPSTTSIPVTVSLSGIWSRTITAGSLVALSGTAIEQGIVAQNALGDAAIVFAAGSTSQVINVPILGYNSDLAAYNPFTLQLVPNDTTFIPQNLDNDLIIYVSPAPYSFDQEVTGVSPGNSSYNGHVASIGSTVVTGDQFNPTATITGDIRPQDLLQYTYTLTNTSGVDSFTNLNFNFGTGGLFNLSGLITASVNGTTVFANSSITLPNMSFYFTDSVGGSPITLAPTEALTFTFTGTVSPLAPNGYENINTTNFSYDVVAGSQDQTGSGVVVYDVTNPYPTLTIAPVGYAYVSPGTAGTAKIIYNATLNGPLDHAMTVNWNIITNAGAGYISDANIDFDDGTFVFQASATAQTVQFEVGIKYDPGSVNQALIVPLYINPLQDQDPSFVAQVSVDQNLNYVPPETYIVTLPDNGVSVVSSMGNNSAITINPTTPFYQANDLVTWTFSVENAGITAASGLSVSQLIDPTKFFNNPADFDLSSITVTNATNVAYNTSTKMLTFDLADVAAATFNGTNIVSGVVSANISVTLLPGATNGEQISNSAITLDYNLAGAQTLTSNVSDFNVFVPYVLSINNVTADVDPYTPNDNMNFIATLTPNAIPAGAKLDPTRTYSFDISATGLTSADYTLPATTSFTMAAGVTTQPFTVVAHYNHLDLDTSKDFTIHTTSEQLNAATGIGTILTVHDFSVTQEISLPSSGNNIGATGHTPTVGSETTTSTAISIITSYTGVLTDFAPNDVLSYDYNVTNTSTVGFTDLQFTYDKGVTYNQSVVDATLNGNAVFANVTLTTDGMTFFFTATQGGSAITVNPGDILSYSILASVMPGIVPSVNSENVTFTYAVANTAFTGMTNSATLNYNVKNPYPTLSIASNVTYVTNDQTTANASFTATLSALQPYNKDVNVTFTVPTNLGNGYISGANFGSGAVYTFTIPAGQLSTTFTVPVIYDAASVTSPITALNIPIQVQAFSDGTFVQDASFVVTIPETNGVYQENGVLVTLPANDVNVVSQVGTNPNITAVNGAHIYKPGDNVTWNVIYQNAGFDAANNIVITQTFDPTVFDVNSFQASIGDLSISGNTLTLTMGNLAGVTYNLGDQAFVYHSIDTVISAKLLLGAAPSNGVPISFDPVNLSYDQVATNIGVTTTTPVDFTYWEPYQLAILAPVNVVVTAGNPNPVMAFTAVLTPNTPPPGGKADLTESFTFNYYITGNQNDYLNPASTTVTFAPGVTSQLINISANLDPTRLSEVKTITVSSSPASANYLPMLNSATATANIITPAISIVETNDHSSDAPQIGEFVDFTVNITNIGNVDITDLQLSNLNLPNGLFLISSGSSQNNYLSLVLDGNHVNISGDLALGQSDSISYRTKVGIVGNGVIFTDQFTAGTANFDAGTVEQSLSSLAGNVSSVAATFTPIPTFTIHSIAPVTAGEGSIIINGSFSNPYFEQVSVNLQGVNGNSSNAANNAVAGVDFSSFSLAQVSPVFTNAQLLNYTFGSGINFSSQVNTLVRPDAYLYDPGTARTFTVHVTSGDGATVPIIGSPAVATILTPIVRGLYATIEASNSTRDSGYWFNDIVNYTITIQSRSNVGITSAQFATFLDSALQYLPNSMMIHTNEGSFHVVDNPNSTQNTIVAELGDNGAMAKDEINVITFQAYLNTEAVNGSSIEVDADAFSSDHDLSTALESVIINPFTPLPTISINSPVVMEGSPVIFTIQMSHQFYSDVTFNWASQNGTATSPLDYNAGNGSVTFSPVVGAYTIPTPTITITTNYTYATTPQSFFIDVSQLDNGILATNVVSGTIINNDNIPLIPSRPSEPTSPVNPIDPNGPYDPYNPYNPWISDNPLDDNNTPWENDNDNWQNDIFAMFDNDIYNDIDFSYGLGRTGSNLTEFSYSINGEVKNPGDFGDTGVDILPPVFHAISEHELEGELQVFLDTVPESDVVFTVISTTHDSISPVSLVFTPENWNTPQKFVIKEDTSNNEQGQAHQIILQTSSEDFDYNGLFFKFDTDGLQKVDGQNGQSDSANAKLFQLQNFLQFNNLDMAGSEKVELSDFANSFALVVNE